MKYPDGYEVTYAMKYALRHIKDLLHFIFVEDKYFIIEDYFILRSNTSLFIPTNSQFIDAFPLILLKNYYFISLIIFVENGIML